MKLFVFDVDNTIIDHTGSKSHIPSSVFIGMKKIIEKKYLPIIATGRNEAHISDLLEELGINSYIVSNGARVVVEGEVIFNVTLTEEQLKPLNELIIEGNLPAIGITNNYLYVNDPDKKFGDVWTSEMRDLSHHVNSRFEKIIKPYDPTCLEYSGISIFKNIDPIDIEGVSFIPWGDLGYEVCLKNVTKATGIEKLAQKLNVSHDNIAVYGDNFNDISMFEKFYNNSYVMGNAPEEVKKYAKYVCKHISEDGLYEGIVDNIERG